MSRRIRENGLILFCFLIYHVNKYPKHMFLAVSNTTSVCNFWLTVTSWGKVLSLSNYHYNKFCHCIECKYIESWLNEQRFKSDYNYIYTKPSFQDRSLKDAFWHKMVLGGPLKCCIQAKMNRLYTFLFWYNTFVWLIQFLLWIKRLWCTVSK